MRQFAIGFALGLLLSGSAVAAFGGLDWRQEERVREIAKEVVSQSSFSCIVIGKGQAINCIISAPPY